MDRKKKLRYLIAVYLVAATLAVLLAYVAFDIRTLTWQSLILNLSTELLGVVLIFILFNTIFLIDDWDLSEEVQDLLDHLRKARPPASQYIQTTPSLEDRIMSADTIDLCGVTLTSTLNRQFSNLRQRLYDGADIRILIIGPDTEILRMAARRSEDTDSTEYYRRRLDATFKDLEYLHQNWEERKSSSDSIGNLDIRLMGYTPSFGISSFNKGKEDAEVFVELYPHHGGFGSPPNLTMSSREDSEWYSYFATQYELMWGFAQPYQVGMTTVPDQEGGERYATEVYSEFFGASLAMREAILDALFKQGSVRIRALGMSMGHAWAFLKNTLLPLLEQDEQSTSVTLEIAMLDSRWIAIDEFNSDWRQRAETNYREIRRFRENYDDKLKKKGWRVSVHRYSHIPNWHGILLDSDMLFLSTCFWREGKLSGAENQYEVMVATDQRLGVHRIDQFSSWFDHIVTSELNQEIAPGE